MHIPKLHLHLVGLFHLISGAISWTVKDRHLLVTLGEESSPLGTTVDLNDVASHVAGAVSPRVRAVLPVVLRTVAGIIAEKHGVDGGASD